MEELPDRFIAFYHYTRNEKAVSSQSDFAKRVGISPSMLTEIIKGRVRPGLLAIQGTVNYFHQLNARWLLTGEGEMLQKVYTNKEKTPNVHDADGEYNTKFNVQLLLNEKDKVITTQQTAIDAQKEAITHLNKRLEDCEKRA